MPGDFFDQALIELTSGQGGDGAALLRREAHVPRGGPSGGDGGRGGHIWITTDLGLNTLLKFQYERKFSAEKGGNGGRNRMHGRNGRDVTITVPVGTLVRTTIDGEPYEVDLYAPGMRLLAARGGRGGLGNVHFKSSTYQTPRIAELGEPGQMLELQLELKLLADVGLVGFPNAGKSTLLSVISAARPKVAPYPFTTLQPNLGVVGVGDFSFVAADIPGLIEGAHRGEGLGFDFLRHIERCRMLIHVVDAAGVDARNPVEDYHKIKQELVQYQPELAVRPRIVALNKIDLPEAQAYLGALQSAALIDGCQVFMIAAATRAGVDELLQHVAAKLREFPTPQRERREEELTWPVPEVDQNLFTVEREGRGFRVRGKKIERLIAMTNFAQPESLMRVQRVLEASGISQALLNAGVKEGDSVYIEKASLTWSDEMEP
jgi:GTP-binding protein